eukprot:gene20258-25157_t
MKDEFPSLTYAHITAWGREGPMRDAPGYDAGAFWAATGMLDVLKASDEEGVGMPRLPPAAGDHATSMSLVAGVALDLFAKQRTGRGQLIDVSLLRSGLWCNGMMLAAAASAPNNPAAVEYMRDPRRLGPTFRAYRCKDGEYVQLLGYQPRRHLPALLESLGLDALPDSEADPAAIDKLFRQKDAAAWETIFDRTGV